MRVIGGTFAGRLADYGFPPPATYAFITIGRNKYAGLAAGGEFSVRDMGVWATRAVTC